MVLEQLSRPVGCGKLAVEDEMVNPEEEISKAFEKQMSGYDHVLAKIMLILNETRPDIIVLQKAGETIGQIQIVKQEHLPPLSEN